MKFIFSDSLDMVDPDFDFIEDRHSKTRRPYWGDVFPHEFFDSPPYDGMLISKATVGDYRIKGQYSESQTMRFHRVGAREFLRLDQPKFNVNLLVFFIISNVPSVDFPSTTICSIFLYL